jgi:RNA polymerase sigma-70 factor (ECF subfamily)
LRDKGSRRADAVDADTLLAAWRAGDDEARDLLLGEVRRRTLRYLAGQRVPVHECEDLAQEVCLAVLAAAPTWQGNGASLWALVFTIARNKHVDRVRRSARQPALGAASESVETALAQRADPREGPEESVVLGEVSARMAALVGELSPNQRDVVLLRVVVGMTVAETAAALGLKHGSVHVLQHRALTTLRTRLSSSAMDGKGQG